MAEWNSPKTIREGYCSMKCSPRNAHQLGTLVPSVQNAVRRRFPTVRHDAVLDAVSAAVERGLTTTFLQIDRSSGELFRWLLTAAVHELLREFRAARRYVNIEAHAETVGDIPGDTLADTTVSRSVLRSWLVARLGDTLAETMWLHTIEGCPPRDIAAMQKVNVRSIKARITRSRRVIRLYRHRLI